MPIENDPLDPLSASAAAPDEPSAAIEDANRRAREAEQRALVAQADLQNVKRRHSEESLRIRDTATQELVLSILPVADDLERALDASAATDNIAALRNGVELTLNRLRAALATVGVERMPGVGTAFDPERHEAAAQTPPTPDAPAGTISQELRPGYTQNGHVIRPSLVAVAQGE